MIPRMAGMITLEAWNSGNSINYSRQSSLMNSYNNSDQILGSSSSGSFFVKIISVEGDILKVDVTPDLTVIEVKSIAIKYFYGNDETETVARFRLIHATQSKILSDEKSLGYLEISESDELLLNEVRSHIDEPSKPSLHLLFEDIEKVNMDMPYLTECKRLVSVPKTPPPKFIDDSFQMMITCIRASAKILMFSENAQDYYDFIKAKLQYLLEPKKENLERLVTLGFTENEVNNTEWLKSKLGKAVSSKWLLNNKNDLEKEGIYIASVNGTSNEKAGSNSSNEASRRNAIENTMSSKSHPNLVHLVDIFLEMLHEQRKLYSYPNKYMINYLLLSEDRSRITEIENALRITGNDLENTKAWLDGNRDPNLKVWRNGLDPNRRLYQTLMNDPFVNLGLSDPEIFFAYLSFLERHRTKVLLNQCSPKVKAHYDRLIDTNFTMRER